MIRHFVSALAVAAVLAAPVAAQTAAPQQAAATAAPTWRIDANHSELTFRVRHLVSRVSGSFGEWSGTVVTEPNRFDQGSVQVAIKTASINTGNARRDEHLRSDDFFDAANHPEITFRSRRVESNGQALKVHGDLTMRGVTKPVVLEGRFIGRTRDGQGKERIGFEAETTINRHDFGVNWNNLVEGSAVVGEDVTISMVVAAVRQ
jgi:polyisoprenoid-binding protein YceI